MSRRAATTANSRHGDNFSDRITRLETRMEDIWGTVDRMEKAIYGNGQPGLLSDVRVIRDSVEQHHQNVEDKQQEKKADWKWIITTTIAITAVIVAIIATK